MCSERILLFYVTSSFTGAESKNEFDTNHQSCSPATKANHCPFKNQFSVKPFNFFEHQFLLIGAIYLLIISNIEIMQTLFYDKFFFLLIDRENSKKLIFPSPDVDL